MSISIIETEVSNLLDSLEHAAAAAGRHDMSDRLDSARKRFFDSTVRVLVVGQPGADASSTSDFLRAELGDLQLTEVPGLSARHPSNAGEALSLVTVSDAVLFVTDASQEFTAPELDFVRQIHALCPFVVCVLTKIDSYSQWKDIQGANRAHLTEAGLGLPILPVSTALKSASDDFDDDELRIESGFPQLIEFLSGTVVQQQDVLARIAFSNDIGSIADHLSLALRTEREALIDPANGAATVAQLERARAEADALRQRSSSWQYTLTDGAVELMTDIEHDLRDRLRAVVRDAEADIAASDPAPRWADFESFVDQKVATAVRENFVMAHTRSVELARAVALRFADDGDITLPSIHIDDVSDVLAPVTALDALESGKAGIVQRVISATRGSYGGILMVGLATSLMGMALVNPFSIGAGVLLGANTFREDRKARTARRQAEARVAVSKLMDDVVFQVNKESKHRLRHVQRTLRATSRRLRRIF
ncbi:hypothetical protein [Rhodococcoides kyotonense]|uniref:Dynamin family protein n=1 Tax=Rhodococcoides kyotonense TaxID=398843 RepID=A0A239LLU2_9NOCA|nr:hypothetical protein [Rhodococcus kyotonensis]SNT31270.1 hypothetical protein SAMN05421642_113145 [Rhodococcus kyotonensis]